MNRQTDKWVNDRKEEKDRYAKSANKNRHTRREKETGQLREQMYNYEHGATRVLNN